MPLADHHMANMKFYMQATFSVSTFVFCVSMVATGHDPSIYLPVLTSVVSYWLPSPEYTHPTRPVQSDPPSPLQSPLPSPLESPPPIPCDV